MGERRDGAAAGGGTGLHLKSEESSSLLQTAVSVLQSSYLDGTSRDGFQYSQAILVENDVFLNELKAFAQAKEAAGYSQEELEETFAFLLFDNEEEAKEVCQTGLRINTSSISTLGDPAKGVYVSRYADYLHPRPWYHGKSGYIVIFKLIKGKVKAVCENYTTSYTCPSPGYDCHVSRNNVSSKTSHFQAFELSQYYVYEVSDGSIAERPRQICPYIVIACQYREPKGMPVLTRESLPELNHKASYCPWRGQLSIRGQLLCNIALRTPYGSTIPAQLPPNLDINHVMGLSDLKKKLPEAAFGKSNYVENEVCFQGIYFSLYEVEISNKDQDKMNELLQNLKEKDLAIIKYLRDQGVLILLTSAALTRDDAFDPEEPVCLLALFLFTSSRSVCLRVDKQDPKAEKEDSDISLKIASVLPGLQYALQKATNSSCEDTVNTSIHIKKHFQEFAKLDQNAQPTFGQNNRVPLSSLLSPAEDECTNPFKKCSEQSFSQLQRYLSNPSSYTLEMSAALGCLAGAVQSLCCNSEAVCNVDVSLVVPPDPIPPSTAAEIKVKRQNPEPAAGLNQGSEGTTAEVSSAGRPRVQQSKRKSSQAIVTSTRKKWSPLKMQMHPVGDSSRNRKATKKKKINIPFSFPKKPGLTANSNEPMLKLANLQFPHRRKRGAEVLSAEFVHKTQSEPVQKGTSALDNPGTETKRPKMLKKPDVKKVPSAQTATKPGKSKMIRSVANSLSKPQAKKQAESEGKEPFSILPSNVPCKSQGGASETSEIYPGDVAAEDIDLQGNNYESHALNLLADLALGSCIPPLIPTNSGTAALSCSPSKEQRSHRKHKASRVAFDHEYHRVDKLAKEGASPSRASPNHKLPPAGKTDLKKDSAPTPREKSPGIPSKKDSLSPNSAKTYALSPKEAQEPVEVNKHSFISSEHSYASPMPEHPRKHTHPRGVPYPGPAPSRNGARSAHPGPLVGKVLPFRHQQNSTHHPQQPFEAVVARHRSGALSPRQKEDFARSHTVNRCGESMKVTCQWEAEYLFNLDSRYTNDALEKTVIRALHGPWDPDLPDDVEEMKLILHMWVALFYSKPSKLLSSTRKVVEHSNPKKYVSINSTRDFFELSDDSEDGFGLEMCPADLRSGPDQTPSSFPEPSMRYQGTFHPEKGPEDSQADTDRTHGVVDSTASSSSGELPSGEELSSTSCPESPSLTECADQSNMAMEDGQPAITLGERVHAASSIAPEEPPREGLLDATITPGLADELGDTSRPSAAPVRENPHNRVLNVSRDPRSSTLCAPHGRGEQLESGCPGPPRKRGSAGDVRCCADVREGSWAASDGPQHACGSLPLEVSPKSAKLDRPGGEGRESQNPLGHPEREKEEMEEKKIEEEDSEYESKVQARIDLSFSEGSNADLEHEDRKLTPVNSARPEDPAVPGEGPMLSPTALASPCQCGLLPVPSAATLPGKTAPSPCALQEPQEALDTPGVETSGVDLVHKASPSDVGSSCDSGLMLRLSPGPNLIRGAPAVGVPAAAVMGSVGLAGEMRGAGLEQSDEDCAPSAETRVPAESAAAGTAGLESPCGQGPILALSAASGPVHLAPLDRATDLRAPLENQAATADVPSPPRSSPGRGDCLSQRCRGDLCADLASLRADGSNQEGNELPVDEERSGSSVSRTEMLGESTAAGQGQGFAFDCKALGGDSEAGKSGDVRSVAGKSPGVDETNPATVANTPPGPETSCCDLLRLPSPSSTRGGTSAVGEPRDDEPTLRVAQQQERSFPNGLSPPAHAGSAPAAPPQDPAPHGRDTDPPCHVLAHSEPGPVLCPRGKPHNQVDAADVSADAASSAVPPAAAGSLQPGCAGQAEKGTGPCAGELLGSSTAKAPGPGDPGSAPPPLPQHGLKAGPCSPELNPVPRARTETRCPTVDPASAPDGAPRSCYVAQVQPGACAGCESPGVCADAVGSCEEGPVLRKEVDGGSCVSLASPASFSAGETFVPLREPSAARHRSKFGAEDASAFADVHRAVSERGEGEIPVPPFPASLLCVRRESGQSLEHSDTRDISDALLRANHFPSRERRAGLSYKNLSYESSSGDSDQEHFRGTVSPLLKSRDSSSTKSTGATDTGTDCDSSSVSLEQMDGCSEGWSSPGAEEGWWRAEPGVPQHGWPLGLGEGGSRHVPPYVNIMDDRGIPRDYLNFTVTRKCGDGAGILQAAERCSCYAGQSHLLRSLVETWRGFEEVTQDTLDMECLRFHYKLKEILRSRKPPFSTSESIFPKDFPPQVTAEPCPGREAPAPLSPRSRSPLQVTLLPSDMRPGGLGRRRRSGRHRAVPRRDGLGGQSSGARAGAPSRDCAAAPIHLCKLRYDNKLKDSRGDIAVILDEYAEFDRVMLSRLSPGSEGAGPGPARGEPAGGRPRAPCPRRQTAAFEDMIADLCNTLRFCLRRVAEEACGRAGLFYLVETGEDLFFARVKTLLKKDGHTEIEPLSFCKAKHLDTDRLLVVIRNEDISSHVHKVPCLLRLKHCPNVVFAGVDSPEDLTGHTYQELFHTGGFVVSDDEVLETVTLGQLKEVVKVLEKLNGSGKWKWLLHYKESKKLREDLRVDANAHKKNLILKSCQGADLIEVLHYHSCDSRSSPKSEYVKCLLNLQVQHISARFAIYLTEKPSVSREVFESQGILVADVNTFLGTVQKVAAPFRRSYW
ncbi:protein TASOR 2 [Struthio camelus]